MAWLDSWQRELIFDYCLRMCSPSEAAQAESLTSRSEAAAELCEKIEIALSPLSRASAEPCPDYLADITVERLCQVARQGIHREQAETRMIQVDLRRHMLWRAAELAVAACLVVTAGAFFLASLLPVPHQFTGQMPQQNIVRRLEVPGWGGNDLRPSYIVDGNGSPTMPNAMPRPSGDDPCHPYRLLDPGLQIVPPPPWEDPEYSSPDRRVQPMPVITPGQEK